MKTQNVTESPSTGYFSEILNINGNADIIFGNLIRGESYKLKVYIESTQGDSTLRTSSSMVIENYTLANGTVLNLMPSRSFNVQCASYRFNTKPGIQVKEPLRWYWQQRYSATGFNSSGCVTVIDQYGEQNPGLPDFRNQTSCGRATCNFRKYQDSIVNQTSLFVAETYIVCPKPNPICISDPVNYEERFNEVYTELNTNQTFKTVLNIEVVPEFTLETISDTSVASLPTVSGIVAQAGNVVEFNTTNTNKADCAFVGTTGATPTAQDFDTCDPSVCANVNTSPIRTLGQIKMDASASGTYTIFVQCKTEIPCSDRFTDISNVGTVTLRGSTTNNGNNTNVNNTNNTNNTTSVGFISFNLFALVMLAFLFFM